MDCGGGVLAVIPARGGSKGLPRKNILDLGGRPLIGWTIEAALRSGAVTRVVVSTDDEEIADIARREGADVPFLRPAHLSGDTATSAGVMTHALENVGGFATAVLLQPTSPFRTGGDIDAACALLVQTGASSCTSVCHATESPYLMFYSGEGSRLERVIGPHVDKNMRRQDLRPVVLLNGAIYVVRVKTFLDDHSFIHDDTAGYVMPGERSIDIDTAQDLQLAADTLAEWGGAVPLRDVSAL